MRVSESERESGPWSLVATPWATFAQTRLPNHGKGALSLDPGDHVWWMLGRAFDGPL